MVDDSLKGLDSARSQRKKSNTDGKSDWVGFVIDVLKCFALTLFIGLIGSNFIFLSGTERVVLDNIMPTDPNEYFPNGFPEDDGEDDAGGDAGAAQKGGGGKQSSSGKQSGSGGGKQSGGGYESCQAFRKYVPKGSLIGYEFPYNMVAWPKSEWDFMQMFKNWVAKSTADTYITSRGVLKDWLDFFAPAAQSTGSTNVFANQTFLMLIVAPLNLCLTFAVFFWGIFSSLFYMLQAGFLWTIVGLFAMYTWIFSGIVGVSHFCQFLKLFIFLPAVTDWAVVKSVMSCNVTMLALVFGWLVCGAAFVSLDPTVAVIMSMVFCVLTIKSLWSEFTKE